MAQQQEHTLHLKEPNNLFTLQNKVTNDLNTFEEKRSRYIQCSDSAMRSLANPPCSEKDSFTELDGAYRNVMQSVTKLDLAMKSDSQQNAHGITRTGFEENITNIQNKYNEIKNLHTKLDNQLEDFQRNVINNNGPKLQLKSSQLIYLLSVIAIICLLYYIVVM